MNNTLVVDGHEQMRVWLGDVAGEAFPGGAVFCAGTLSQARQLLQQEQFDLVLVDISLPDGSGIDLITELTAADSDIYPVVTTIHDDDRHLFAALEAGAKGYLLKEQPKEQLVSQLAGILRGEPPLSPSIARRILRSFTRGRGSRNPSHTAVLLTEREQEVLHLLAHGYTRNNIAEALDISPNTAAGYIKSIYRKLNVSGRAEAALEAVRMGLVDSAKLSLHDA